MIDVYEEILINQSNSKNMSEYKINNKEHRMKFSSRLSLKDF